MQLLVVRHGETKFNREGRYLGALDPALAPEGVAQARLLRDELANRLDVVFCSPLRRARQTAEIICRGTSLECTELAWLRERNVGVFEGLTPDEAKERFPELWGRNITRQWAAAPLGGETIEQVVVRVREGLAKLHSAHVGSRCGVVCHGFVAKVVRALCGAGFEDFFEWQLPTGDVLNVTADRSFDADAQMPPCAMLTGIMRAGQVPRYPSRVLGLITADVETCESGAGHVVAEAYLHDVRKWVLLDAQPDAIPIVDEAPANAVELAQAFWRRSSRVKFASRSAHDLSEYPVWLERYLYYFTTSLDHRFGVTRQPETIRLAPMGAREPRLFQRSHPLPGASIYTHSVTAFYPLPRQTTE